MACQLTGAGVRSIRGIWGSVYCRNRGRPVPGFRRQAIAATHATLPDRSTRPARHGEAGPPCQAGPEFGGRAHSRIPVCMARRTCDKLAERFSSQTARMAPGSIEWGKVCGADAILSTAKTAGASVPINLKAAAPTPPRHASPGAASAARISTRPLAGVTRVPVGRSVRSAREGNVLSLHHAPANRNLDEIISSLTSRNRQAFDFASSAQVGFATRCREHITNARETFGGPFVPAHHGSECWAATANGAHAARIG